jgi:hypothetical protein
MTVSEPQTRLQIRRPIACPDRHHAPDARVQRALNHGLAIAIELFAV